MKKNFFAAALILSLGVGSFAACSSDDVPVNPTEKKKTTTMMSIAITMPAASASRATDEPNNYIGQWLGQEKVEKVDVYVFNGTAATSTLEAHETFNAGDYAPGVVGGQVVFRPNKGIAISAGTKEVYVVVNSNTATTTHLSSVSTVGTTQLSAFEAKYKSVASAVTNTGTASAVATTDNSAAGEFAKLDKGGFTNPSQWKNEIVMTGDKSNTPITIADNVSEATAIAGGSNLVALTVKRVVARVAVTSSAADFTLQGDDPYTSAVETTAVLGKVTGFTYVAAQGERKVNFLQEQTATAAELTSNDGTHSYRWNSPAYSFISTSGYAVAGDAVAADARAKYDYAPLWQKPTGAPAGGLMGHPVPLYAAFSTAQTDANAQAIGELMEGDFLLPTTHRYYATAPNGTTENGYYKGNTAYVLIRSIFTPEKIVVDGDPNVAPDAPAGTPRPNYPSTVKSEESFAAIATANRPEILVRGSNGKFYSTVFASQAPMYQGVNGQSIEIFQAVKNATNEIVGYKMLYFAWVNPDNVAGSKWINSPVYRNNIYHIQLDGVTGIGTSYNPLVPADPTKPSGSTPDNPDQLTVPPTVNVPTTPGPVTPTTPVTPVTPTPTPTPVQPQNPLTPNKTFMAVKTTVLPWQVHGYKFNLHNQ